MASLWLNRFVRGIKGNVPLVSSDVSDEFLEGSCYERRLGDAPVTGTGRNWHICKVDAGGRIFAETASDALGSN
jgi:hypothetical protein